MASKRAKRRRSCEGKRRHPDRDAAAAHAGRLNRGRDAADRVEPYRCRHCRGWHVGHRPDARREGR